MATVRESPPPECAVCGADVPPGARACPECGADERTGWRDQSIYDGLDLPDEAWSGDGRGDAGARPWRGGPAWYWWLTALLLLIALGFAFLGFN